MKIPILLFFLSILVPISGQVKIELTLHQAEKFTVDLGADTSLCANETLILGISGDFPSYLWSTNEVAQSISINSSGTYFVSVVDNNHCTAMDTISVIFNELPEINLCGDTALCNGETLTIDAGAGYKSYEWNDGTTGQTLDVDSAGQYYVTVENEFACTNSDTVQVSYSVCAGIKNIVVSKIKIIPNPNNGKFKIDLGQSIRCPIAISVYNNMGGMVFKDDFYTGLIELNLGAQPKGIYYINFLSKNIKATKKIIIE